MATAYMRNAVISQTGSRLGRTVCRHEGKAQRKRDGRYVTEECLSRPASLRRDRRPRNAGYLGFIRVNTRRCASVMRNQSSDVFSKSEDGSIVIKIPSLKKVKATASKAIANTQRFFSPILPFAIPFSFAALLGVIAVKLSQSSSGTSPGNKRIVYDRSLGGRAVQVTGSSAEWDVDGRSNSRRPVKATDVNKKHQNSQVGSPADWWVALPPLDSVSRAAELQELQEHQQLLKDLESKRVAGQDAFLSEILQLVDACERDNVSLTSALPSNVRESYFRDACSMIVKGILGGYQDPPSSPEKIAQIARTMGIDSMKGSTIVTGNVAAQLRSSLIDSAVEARRVRASATNDLSIALMEARIETNMIGVKRLLSAFPFRMDSPELELLKEGLRNRIQEAESRAIWTAFQSIINPDRDNERKIQDQIREALNVM